MLVNVQDKEILKLQELYLKVEVEKKKSQFVHFKCSTHWKFQNLWNFILLIKRLVIHIGNLFECKLNFTKRPWNELKVHFN